MVNAILQNAGQTCSAGSRLLVDERGVHDRLVAAMAERFRAVRSGRGADDPELGPLISEQQLERVRGSSRAPGTSARVGGGPPEGLGGGYYFSPTLFDQVCPGRRDSARGGVRTGAGGDGFRDLDEAIAADERHRLRAGRGCVDAGRQAGAPACPRCRSVRYT